MHSLTQQYTWRNCYMPGTVLVVWNAPMENEKTPFFLECFLEGEDKLR